MEDFKVVIKVELIKSASIRETLQHPTTTPGQRHNEALRVCAYLTGENYDENDIIQLLEKSYPSIAQRSNKEIRDMVEGARSLGLTPAHSGQSAPVDRHRFRVGSYITPLHIANAGGENKLPSPIENATIQFLKSSFREGEYVSITNDSEPIGEGKHRIVSRGTTKTREAWLLWFESRKGFLDCDGGAWVRVNPVSECGSTDKDVTDYRHCLVEFDDLDHLKQWQAIRQSDLPVSAVIDSAGKSLHAWVRVDAKSKEEYDQRVEKVYSFLAEFKPDPANRNPSRWSRLPGICRNDKEQTLLAVNIGCTSWDEWEVKQEATELPLECDLSTLESFDRSNDANSVIGNRWLCKGGSLLIQAQSGIGKSTLTMQAAISWAVGRDLFGIKAIKPLRIAIIQAENDDGDMAEMFQDSTRAMGLNDEERKLLKQNLRIFRETVRTGQEFIRMTKNIIRSTRADLVFADPLLSFVGDDISKQDKASQFLRNWLNPILLESGAIIAFVHHMGKPKSKQDATGQTDSDIAYAGLGSSELVNWARETLTIRRLEEQGNKFEMILSKRGKRAGILDAQGQPTTRLKIRHSSTGVTWEVDEQGPKYRLKKSDPHKDILRKMPAMYRESAIAFVSDACGVDKTEAYRLIRSAIGSGYVIYCEIEQTYKGI